jgi:hypothetical protein
MSNTDDVAVEDLIRRKLASRSDTMCTASCITLRRQFWLVAIIPTGTLSTMARTSVVARAEIPATRFRP